MLNYIYIVHNYGTINIIGRVKGEWSFAWIPKYVVKTSKKISPLLEGIIRIKYYSYIIYRDTVMMLLGLIDPSGSKCRKKHRLQRRVYRSEVVYYYIILIFFIKLNL